MRLAPSSRSRLESVKVTSNAGEWFGSVSRKAEQVALPSEYDIEDEDVKFDLALVMLREPFNYSSDKIGAATLAGAQLPDLQVGDPCVVAGWGDTESK